MNTESQNSIPLTLEIEELLPLLPSDQILLIAVCAEDIFIKHHIPESALIEPAELVCGIKPAIGKLPDAEKLSLVFSRIGLRKDKHVVAYDDEGGGWAGRLIWTLDILGHQNCSFLNGGLVAWINESYPVSSDPPKQDPSDYIAKIDRKFIANLEDVLNQIGDASSIVWDARDAEEFAGTKVTAIKNGHIPGAVNMDWLNLMDCDRNLRLKSLDVLERELESLGINKHKKIITHCQTHHRSGLSYLVGKMLGFDIKAYDGSWSEWGNHPNTPVERK
ncbi:MAG: rhodanese-like domain-containing protein [Pseudomonadota bacterium]|nr:rhodanese-like domain-containing protein [Pseudomonadota bacterium]MEC8996011.1 rhodanese-like domain-containing protein [Pseudomonadota bacterium]MED5385182.1 rhodanese-like domain-containing protein [Pseudomonadota bacterium]